MRENDQSRRRKGITQGVNSHFYPHMPALPPLHTKPAVEFSSRLSQFVYELPGFLHSVFVVRGTYKDVLLSHLHALLDTFF